MYTNVSENQSCVPGAVDQPGILMLKDRIQSQYKQLMDAVQSLENTGHRIVNDNVAVAELKKEPIKSSGHFEDLEKSLMDMQELINRTHAISSKFERLF